MTHPLNETVSFKYNFKNELMQIKPVNLWYPGYDYTLNFTYDNYGNVTMVVTVPESAASYTTYAATSYDHKPNFLGGNPWLKYIQFHH